jgi:CRISPR-associated protein Cmr1
VRKHPTSPERESRLRSLTEQAVERAGAIEASLESPEGASADGSRIIEYQCTLVTPMYGGGVKAGVVDRSMPIRATSIRGQLRHWWRFLNRFGTDGALLSPGDLFERERAIWGGLGDADTLARSKVTVRVTGVRDVRDTDLFSAKSIKIIDGRNKAVWNDRVLRAQYALFPAQGKHVQNAVAFQEDPAKLLDAGIRFTLQLTRSGRLDDASWTSVHQAVRWWANFGGVGARTRRGLGAVLVTGQDGKTLLIPSEEELAANGCSLGLLETSHHPDAGSAWFGVIGELKSFRQILERKTNELRWMEAKVIRQISGYSHSSGDASSLPFAFPRAMFGLPIISHFKDSERFPDKHPQDTELLPVPAGSGTSANRMASPMILRPIFCNDQWRPGALLLPTDHVDEMALKLCFTHKTDGAQERHMNKGDWWRTEYAAAIPAMQGRDSNPLWCFMRRFTGKAIPTVSASASPVRIAHERPNLTRNNRNGAITIETRNDNRRIVLTGEDARICFLGLSTYAQQRLQSSKPFNRLNITVEGSRFIELEEYPQ